MSVILVLTSILIISANMDGVSGFFDGLRGFRNSFLNQEVIIEGSGAEEIYLTEQSNQTKELQKLQEDEREALASVKAGKWLSGWNSRKLNSFSAEAYRLNQAAREKDFCEEEDVCPRAFKNTFFSKKSFSRNWEAGAKTVCVDKKIVARKGGKPQTSTNRQLVQCDITSTTGISKVYLAPSTKYDSEKNLKFFALVEEDGNAKPIAYLMNKKEPKRKINRSGSARLAEMAAHSSVTDGQMLGSIADSLRYSSMYPLQLF